MATMAKYTQSTENAESNEASGKLPPTLALNPHRELRVMREEIFGPLLPVIGVKDLDAAIAFVNARPHPLALVYPPYRRGLFKLLRII